MLPPVVSPLTVAVAVYDGQRPDGLTKEVIVRAASLGLLKAAGGAASLVHLHDDLDATVAAAVAGGAGVVNPVVKRLVALDAVNVPAGESVTDATAALAGSVYDVSLNKLLSIDTPAQPSPAAKAGAVAPTVGPTFDGAGADDADLSGLDLLSPEFEPLRLVLTRTLMAVRPDLYAAYRAMKDGGTADARERAYGYAFGLLRKVIDQTHGGGEAP